MIIKDIPEEVVHLLVGPQLERGWEYTYWGKKITIGETDKVTKDNFASIIAVILEADDYDIPVKLTRKILQWPIEPPVSYYACIYMDKHDGDSYGTVVFHEDAIKKGIKKLEKIWEIKKREFLDGKDEDWKDEN